MTPAAVPGAVITAADFVNIAPGLTRVTVTHTAGLQSAPSGEGGMTSELVGGAREVPTESHDTFKDSVTPAQLVEIKAAIQENRQIDASIVPNQSSNKARQLYNLLYRGQEYYLAPAVSYRETTLERSFPSLRELCTINAPSRAPNVSSQQNWLLTSINGRSVASPTGNVNYEVTREWLLSDRKGWDPERIIYQGT